MEISKKMISAAELGIPVLTIQEFSERYNIPQKRFQELEQEEKEEEII